MSEPENTTVLIVDDNTGARRSIEGLLTSQGYKLLVASNGAEAMEIAKTDYPDLILLDVMMPGKNGYEVCEEIRADADIAEVPIIMITGLDDDDSMMKGIEAGADDFLTKPINKIELRSRVKGIARLNRYRKLWGERQKFEWVVKHSQFGYIILNEKDLITFTNDRACEILGLSEIEADEKPSFFKVIKKRYTSKPVDIESIWKMSLEKETVSPEPFILVSPKKGGKSARWIKATILSLQKMTPGLKMLRLEDITASMMSFQEKHTFSRMMSHKLLTPLNSLKAAQQMMGVSANAETSGLFRKVSDLQKKGIDRLEYDIDSILKFLESNSLNGRRETTSLQELEEQLRSIGDEDGVPFCLLTDLGDKESWVTHISPIRFETCIREIIENSVKFHPKGSPSLTWSIQVFNTGDTAILTFENDGDPILEEELANAWKPYWQADRYRTGEVRGMGLGLSLIAANIWGAGGTCSIANRKDKSGAIVTLTLPIFPEASRQAKSG